LFTNSRKKTFVWKGRANRGGHWWHYLEKP
jgi:hypothetical protein